MNKVTDEFGFPPTASEREDRERLALDRAIIDHFVEGKPDAMLAALPYLTRYPNHSQGYFWVIMAALLDRKPQQALRYLDRLVKKFIVDPEESQVLQVVIHAQQGNWSLASELLKKQDWLSIRRSIHRLPYPMHYQQWLQRWMDEVLKEEGRSWAEQRKAEQQAKREAAKRQTAKKTREESRPSGQRAIDPEAEKSGPAEEPPDLPTLSRHQIKLPLSLEWAPTLASDLAAVAPARNEEDWRRAQLDFRLRFQHTQLGLLQGFDDLLCLSTLHGVDTYWYQVEAVRKVLKQFRGRVLLADEVGLGKTIEAGMALKEYLMRGMVEKVLILTPASLVGQWREEMAVKFGIECASTYDSQLKNNPEEFWAQPRVIASIATARRAEQQAILSRQHYDMVIVDEAHHLKNRQTANWKLVDSLQKKFLLLLSATPVQNSLVELFNLLTLLKPGLFKTEKEFRARYMTSGKPRVPANRDQMRDLMREVMIRNTRSLVDVKLPPRHAKTFLLDPLPEEEGCYRELSHLIAGQYEKSPAPQRLALRHLLSAAGSTATTAAAALGRYAETRKVARPWLALQQRYTSLSQSSKEKSLLELLGHNRTEKKMVFVHHRETLHRLDALLSAHGFPHVIFEGGLSGPEKDAVIARFEAEAPLLLCTESGGEGRNLQFCNTLINFDLPWNPMIIEQRIGRVHRIGQAREVFIFNLATRGTIEDQILRILDEKINMFELVVGEIDSILGELEDEQDFTDLVFQAWVETTEEERGAVFADLGEKMAQAKARYDSVKALDTELFGDDFVAS